MILPSVFIILSGLWIYSRKKEKPLIQPIHPPLQIQINGFHWNIAYQLGVAAAFQEFLDMNHVQWYGCSFGSLISTALHLDLPLIEIYHLLLQLASYKGIQFIWNFNKIYQSFIHRYYNKDVSSPITYIFTQVSLKQAKWIEVKDIQYKELLKIAYPLPFPSCIPKKIEPYGYMIDAYWSYAPLKKNGIYISLESSSHIPPPIQLQYKNLFYSDKIQELYTIGYKRAFIKLHCESSWEPYFKEAKKIENIRLCRSYLNDIDELCMKFE